MVMKPTIHVNVEEYLMLYYIQIMPPTCFGHTCGHP